MFRSFFSPQIWSLILVQFGLICIHKASSLSVLEVSGSMSSYLRYGFVELATAVTFWRNEVSNSANFLLDVFVDGCENIPVNSKCLCFRGMSLDTE